MSVERELLRAIVENPSDRKLRRAYADWLVARGEPQGEYIRARRRLKRLSYRDPRRIELSKHVRSLHWTSEAVLGFRFETCSEWLPRQIMVDAASYATEGRDPIFLSTASKLIITHPHAWPFSFHATPWIHGVTELSFWVERGNSLADGLGEAGARSLASALRQPRLVSLDLCGNAIGDAGAAALAASPGLTHLKQLRLGDRGLQEFPGNDIGDEGARRLANSQNLSALVSMDLACNAIGDEGARAFAASSFLPSLTVLSLRDNRIGYTGAWELIDSPLAARLTQLDLSNNRLGLSWSPLLDWDGSIVGEHYDEIIEEPEWLRLRPRIFRFLPMELRRRGEALPPG